MMLIIIGAIVRWSSSASMKNVDVAWRSIYVVKEWQKLKKDYNLEIYLRITKISGNKHIEYFYEKENFMADSILKLR